MRSFHTHSFADRFYTILKRDPTNLKNVKHKHVLFKKRKIYCTCTNFVVKKMCKTPRNLKYVVNVNYTNSIHFLAENFRMVDIKINT